MTVTVLSAPIRRKAFGSKLVGVAAASPAWPGPPAAAARPGRQKPRVRPALPCRKRRRLSFWMANSLMDGLLGKRPGGFVNGRADALVGRAPAKVARHGSVD